MQRELFRRHDPQGRLPLRRLGVVGFALLLLLLPAPLLARGTPLAGRWTETEPPIDLAHIDRGEINRRGDPVGYHHRASGVDPPEARVVAIIQAPDAAGVYRARVEIEDPASGAWLDKRAASTFFPDRMSDADVVAAILAAFHDGVRRRDGRFVGASGFGFTVEGWYRHGRILAAYPLRRP
jgi:Bacterial EndoU nuclease